MTTIERGDVVTTDEFIERYVAPDDVFVVTGIDAERGLATIRHTRDFGEWVEGPAGTVSIERLHLVHHHEGRPCADPSCDDFDGYVGYHR